MAEFETAQQQWKQGQCGFHNNLTITNWRRHLLPNPNVLVAVSKGMWAIKFCCNKILQFLTGDAG